MAFLCVRGGSHARPAHPRFACGRVREGRVTAPHNGAAQDPLVDA